MIRTKSTKQLRKVSEKLKKGYISYPFALRDPVLVRTLEMIGDMPLKDVAKSSGVARGTIKRWRDKTRKPQFCTIAAVWLGLGKKSIPL